MNNETRTECCLREFDRLMTHIHGDLKNDNYSWEWQQMGDFCHAKVDQLKQLDCLPANLVSRMNDYTIPIYGYVTPFLGVAMFITNILVCIVLMKKHMRSPTNILLAAMAIADLLTGVIPVPGFIYFYTLDNYEEWLTCPREYLYNITAIQFPTIFHTASIWLTVALAVQRYICVCKPNSARKWCTVRNAIIAVVIIYALAAVSQSTRFWEHSYQTTDLPSLLHSNTVLGGCIVKDTVLTGDLQDAYWNIYWVSRVVFVHVIPCLTLVIMNALLIRTMRAAQRRRAQLLMQNRSQESRRLQENNRTTFMLVAVVGLFLLVEVPLAVFLILMILQNTGICPDLLNDSVNELASLVINVFILLSYPINFVIYCTMSRQFRKTFYSVFKGICTREEPPAPCDRRSRYQSLTTENNTNKTMVMNETVT